jgi:glutaredoxin-like protein NrdH
MSVEHVNGEKKGDVFLYALSTCVWCRKTRKLLEELSVEYDFVYVDLLEGEERSQIIKDLEKWNPQLSFPTLVVNNNNCLVGYNKDRIREIIG